MTLSTLNLGNGTIVYYSILGSCKINRIHSHTPSLPLAAMHHSTAKVFWARGNIGIRQEGLHLAITLFGGLGWVRLQGLGFRI